MQARFQATRLLLMITIIATRVVDACFFPASLFQPLNRFIHISVSVPSSLPPSHSLCIHMHALFSFSLIIHAYVHTHTQTHTRTRKHTNMLINTYIHIDTTIRIPTYCFYAFIQPLLINKVILLSRHITLSFGQNTHVHQQATCTLHLHRLQCPLRRLGQRSLRTTCRRLHAEQHPPHHTRPSLDRGSTNCWHPVPRVGGQKKKGLAGC